MNVIDISLAVKKAISQLEESGKIAKTKEAYRETTTPFATAYNEELGGLAVAQIEGTLGIEKTDTAASFMYVKDGEAYVFPNLEGEVPVTSPLVLGNEALGGMGDDTGEGYLIIVDFEQNASLIVTRTALEAEMHVTAYYTAVTDPIDPKFIPGVVLPVVEIDKEGLLTEPSALSEAEAETIEKIVNAGNKYILVSVFVGGIPVATTILRKVIEEEEIAFMGMAGTGSFMIAKENGQWAIVVD